ncbi:MAG TPA: CDP-diacylglycerol--glycerol-3-phosphate 3-phosphatidyltransferase [Planctomycetaceae bacterium]|jgi:CDP-diacylglycerol--glycerol-3-phosphate 3-phosphatidyltransferase
MPATEQRDLPPAPQPASGAGGDPKPPAALNLPNLITLSRFALSIVLFYLIDIGHHWLAATALFVIAAATDFLDGYIARRYGLVTKVGRILDPFVDKVIIGGAFLFLAMHPDSGVNAWMVFTVIGREMFVTSLRSVLEQEGKDFSAVMSGKIKMVVQCAAVAGALLFLEYGPGSSSEQTLALTRDVLLWSAVAVTLYSGYEYVIRAAKMFRGG